ncbi:hypothetical protein [Stutzerimonas nitrititolerans]|uniref:hypothetical protein n=1 Tax=Stutzerimonas nitrititolerans TaxID=2482751 RepID=UPI0028A6C219|nr:hypothetical protein [Stutzerimonas nitrititolerans]
MDGFPISQAVVDIIAQGNFTAIYAVELQFASDTVRAHTGTGQILLGGQVYTGVGQLGEVGGARETDSPAGPASIDVTLSGLDSNILRQTLVERCRGRPGRVMFVVIGKDGEMAADVIMSGRMDAAKFNYGGNDGKNSISVTIIDRMAEWSRPGSKRWTDENHQLRHPGDRIFFAIAQLSESPIFWGSKKDAPSFRYD